MCLLNFISDRVIGVCMYAAMPGSPAGQSPFVAQVGVGVMAPLPSKSAPAFRQISGYEPENHQDALSYHTLMTFQMSETDSCQNCNFA